MHYLYLVFILEASFFPLRTTHNLAIQLDCDSLGGKIEVFDKIHERELIVELSYFTIDAELQKLTFGLAHEGWITRRISVSTPLASALIRIAARPELNSGISAEIVATPSRWVFIE